MVELRALGKQDEIGTAESLDSPVFTDIRLHSDWVLPAIQDILDEQPQLTFTPADVYIACEEGSAGLWIADEGFVISTGVTDEFTGNRTFLIWLAWAKKRGENCVIKYFDFFEEVAREAGFINIEVRTPVRELEPYLLNENWKLDTVVYTRAL